jgi:hypothetical protein
MYLTILNNTIFLIFIVLVVIATALIITTLYKLALDPINRNLTDKKNQYFDLKQRVKDLREAKLKINSEYEKQKKEIDLLLITQQEIIKENEKLKQLINILKSKKVKIDNKSLDLLLLSM